MSTLKRALTKVGYKLDDRFDRIWARWHSRLSRHGQALILLYRGYGTREVLRLQGRVLKDKNIPLSTDEDSTWDNIVSMYKRFNSAEIGGARVRGQVGDAEEEVLTDSEGYFELTLNPTMLPEGEVWHSVAVHLLEVPGGVKDVHVDEEGELDVSLNGVPTEAVGTVLVPNQNAQFGVISDIDDTIVRTNATNLLRMAQVTFFNNARSRLPFEGVAAFYQALQLGSTGQVFNPIFYVSSSPWNLYDLLTDFMDVHAIPAGPLFLQDYGLDRNKFISADHDEHKIARIERLLDLYPHLPFILIGDSGQADPEIYSTILEKYPDRILAIYIRDIHPAKPLDERDRDVQALVEKSREANVDLLLVPDTLAAAEHALANGWIREESLALVRADQQLDAASEPRPAEAAEQLAERVQSGLSPSQPVE